MEDRFSAALKSAEGESPNELPLVALDSRRTNHRPSLIEIPQEETTTSKIFSRRKEVGSFRFMTRKPKAKKNAESPDVFRTEKNLFGKLFGWANKTENIVNVDLLETQAAMDTRAQYGDVRDLMQTDATGRTIIHRAALEQNSRLLNELCEEAAKTSNQLAFIDRPDMFGNTPLLLSCLLNLSEDSAKRAKCFDILISHGANINVKNKRTMWTPIMWCAYYGDDRGIRKLIAEGARCYCPDYKGFFPSDWAGIRVSYHFIELVLRYSIDRDMWVVWN